jgi:hypothetical protein
MQAASARALDAISCARREAVNVWARARSTWATAAIPANARATAEALLTSGAFYLTIDATPRAFPHSFRPRDAAGFVLFAGADIDFHMFKMIDGKIPWINAVVGPAVTSSGWPAK